MDFEKKISARFKFYFGKKVKDKQSIQKVSQGTYSRSVMKVFLVFQKALSSSYSLLLILRFFFNTLHINILGGK